MNGPANSPPLTHALRLSREGAKPLIAIVGAGGKTTTMTTLAAELAAQGWRVVTTTTTRLFASQREASGAWCAWDDLDALSGLLDRHGRCLVGHVDGSRSSVAGLTVAQVQVLHRRADVDAVIVEADGSRSRLIKAPAPHEPVIPLHSTHLVALVGADIFGKALTDAVAHRAERVAEVAAIPMQSIVTPDGVARLLTAPHGALQGKPAQAAFIPFFNRAEDRADKLQAERCAELLLADPQLREVLIGSLHEGWLERRSRTAAVVLAAGEGKRFGATKQLLEWRGQPLVAHVCETALACCETVLVVVGHEAEAVAHAVDHLPVELIHNPDYAAGQGGSVARAAEALLAPNRPYIGAAFFLMVDQPLVDADLLRRLADARGLRTIAVPHHGGQRNSPVLFDRAHFHALSTLSGNVGGRALIQRHPADIAWLEVDDPATLQDIDQPEDWEAFNR